MKAWQRGNMLQQMLAARTSCREMPACNSGYVLTLAAVWQLCITCRAAGVPAHCILMTSASCTGRNTRQF